MSAAAPAAAVHIYELINANPDTPGRPNFLGVQHAKSPFVHQRWYAAAENPALNQPTPYYLVSFLAPSQLVGLSSFWASKPIIWLRADNTPYPTENDRTMMVVNYNSLTNQIVPDATLRAAAAAAVAPPPSLVTALHDTAQKMLDGRALATGVGNLKAKLDFEKMNQPASLVQAILPGCKGLTRPVQLRTMAASRVFTNPPLPWSGTAENDVVVQFHANPPHVQGSVVQAAGPQGRYLTIVVAPFAPTNIPGGYNYFKALTPEAFQLFGNADLAALLDEAILHYRPYVPLVPPPGHSHETLTNALLVIAKDIPGLAM